MSSCPETSQRADGAERATARLTVFGVAAGLIAAGLLLRLVHWGLPLAVSHSAGGFLWGGMVYALVATARPAKWRLKATLLLSLAIIIAVESVRLVHAPWLDAFRATLAGRLLLGRIFSSWNYLVDGLGAAVIAGLTARFV